MINENEMDYLFISNECMNECYIQLPSSNENRDDIKQCHTLAQYSYEYSMYSRVVRYSRERVLHVLDSSNVIDIFIEQHICTKLCKDMGLKE